MKVGFLGPDGTFSQEAVLAAPGGADFEPAPQPTLHDTVMAVHEGRVDRALVPIENSLEGAVNATLDALAFETDDVVILGELVHPIRYCLIARAPAALETIRGVVSHPQAVGQCARFLRTRLPRATVIPAASTAEAVRAVAARQPGEELWTALGTRLAAELYGCEVLEAGVEDVAGNETRFVWIGRAGSDPPQAGPGAAWKTAIVFWGAGDEAPGWLVRCLAEFASRDINLTRIESRPRRQGLGRYMFFLDLEGREHDAPVAEAIAAMRDHAEAVRVLGSFPAAA
ncbi:MAG: prephenate dehydratase [Solirubrobacteraceae bacterium]